MMRPYYTDPYTLEFKSEILKSIIVRGKPAVILSESYFYPTSGGQEHDTGTINGTDVVDVVEENGEVVHVLAEKLNEGPADCKIDRERRVSNMQQHTGQHILSAAFENLFGIETVSSRLGETTGTIDLSRQPTPDEVSEVVSKANEVVRDDRKVIVHFADKSDISSFKLRKPPKVEGTVRIIEVKDFDFSACGGTHCTHTSEVGPILTGNLEKIKASLTRIEFYCGGRAIHQYNMLNGIVLESTRLLSTQPTELSVAIQKLKNQSQEKDGKIKALSERVLSALCQRLSEQLRKSQEQLAIVDLNEEVADSNELRYVSSCVAREIDKSFMFHRQEQNVCQINLNLKGDDRQIQILIDSLRKDHDAKGGGRNGFYTLNFESSKLQEIIAVMKKALLNG